MHIDFQDTYGLELRPPVTSAVRVPRVPGPLFPKPEREPSAIPFVGSQVSNDSRRRAGRSVGGNFVLGNRSLQSGISRPPQHKWRVGPGDYNIDRTSANEADIAIANRGFTFGHAPRLPNDRRLGAATPSGPSIQTTKSGLTHTQPSPAIMPTFPSTYKCVFAKSSPTDGFCSALTTALPTCPQSCGGSEPHHPTRSPPKPPSGGQQVPFPGHGPKDHHAGKEGRVPANPA